MSQTAAASSAGGAGVSGSDLAVVASQVSAAMYNYYSGVFNTIFAKRQVKWGSIPEYSNPLDYQAQRSYAIEIIIGAMFVMFIAIGVAIALRR